MGWVLLALAAVAAAGLLYFGWFARPPARPELAKRPMPGGESGADEGVGVGAPRDGGVGGAPEPQAPAAPPPRSSGHLALVFDDLGRSVAEMETVAALGVPLTYSVLPYEAATAEVAAALRGRGVEILLHLPMTASNGHDPGPGTLHPAMSPAALAAGTRRALQQVPGAVGVNNHMGSELTRDSAAMEPILRALHEEEMFFLDSRTSAESVGYRLARGLGLPAAERQVFLDPDPEPEAIRGQFRRLLELAAERGAAIAIAHPHPQTLAVLREEVPRALAAGFEFVPVSFLLDRSPVLPAE